MKKRIGTKFYNTETAVCVFPELGLYKQGHKQSYFLFDGITITPLEYSEASKILEENGFVNLTKHVDGYRVRAKIAVTPEMADKLAAYCRSHNVTQRQVIENFINSLEI